MNIISSVCLFLCARVCVGMDWVDIYLTWSLYEYFFFTTFCSCFGVCVVVRRGSKSLRPRWQFLVLSRKLGKRAESLRIQGINERRRSEVVWIVPQFKFFTSEKRDRMYPKHDPAEPKRQHHQKINTFQRFRPAKKYLNFTVDDWKWVLFTDKFKFEKEYQDFRQRYSSILNQLWIMVVGRCRSWTHGPNWLHNDNERSSILQRSAPPVLL